MARLFDVVTFDCYGTLVDWERGIGEACRAAAAADGASGLLTDRASASVG